MASIAPASFIYRVEPPTEPRQRLSVLFRPILALPHLLIVGGPGIGVGGGTRGLGVYGMFAAVAALINWFAIVFTGRALPGLQKIQHQYLSWRGNALAYQALLRDEYPPFGEDAYPVTTSFVSVDADRNRWTVGFRLILAIPHFVAMAFLLVAWFFTTVIGWFALLFSGSYPEGLWRFSEGVMRWSLRLEAYLLLVNDDYPPFSLE